jgi:succinoglycan biosynthesis transport protein ExoP
VELRVFLQILRRRWLSALIVALVLFLAVMVVNLSTTKKYTATNKLFFAVQGAVSGSGLAQGSTYAEKQMASYAQVATSPLVLDSVIRQLGLQTTATELAQSVSATVPTDTVILEIGATSTDPALAAKIANSIGEELSDVVRSLAPPQSNGSQVIKATTLERAEVPQEPSSPNILRNSLIGFALALVLGVSIAILRHLLDTKVRSESDVRALTDSPVLGVVSYAEEMPRHPVILRDQPASAPSEAVRRLRTNLQFIDVARRPRSIVVTSSIPGEGKSTIVLNLAVSLADTGARVLLVDADLRRPSIADYTGVEGAAGLTTVLIGRARGADVVQPWGDSTLDIMPSGPLPPNPSELLGSPAMVALLEQLTSSYDMVLLDSPPTLPVADSAVLSKLAGGALVIVGTDRIHRAQLLGTLESLNTAGAHIFGVVINKVSRRDAGSYGYDAAYGSRAGDRPTQGPSGQISGTEKLRPFATRQLEGAQVAERIRISL